VAARGGYGKWRRRRRQGALAATLPGRCCRRSIYDVIKDDYYIQCATIIFCSSDPKQLHLNNLNCHIVACGFNLIVIIKYGVINQPGDN
jgi:hypothetical protein